MLTKHVKSLNCPGLISSLFLFATEDYIHSLKHSNLSFLFSVLLQFGTTCKTVWKSFLKLWNRSWKCISFKRKKKSNNNVYAMITQYNLIKARIFMLKVNICMDGCSIYACMPGCMCMYSTTLV